MKHIAFVAVLALAFLSSCLRWSPAISTRSGNPELSFESTDVGAVRSEVMDQLFMDGWKLAADGNESVEMEREATGSVSAMYFPGGRHHARVSFFQRGEFVGVSAVCTISNYTAGTVPDRSDMPLMVQRSLERARDALRKPAKTH